MPPFAGCERVKLQHDLVIEHLRRRPAGRRLSSQIMLAASTSHTSKVFFLPSPTRIWETPKRAEED
jgi:hypothetical protein